MGRCAKGLTFDSSLEEHSRQTEQSGQGQKNSGEASLRDTWITGKMELPETKAGRVSKARPWGNRRSLMLS